jgi:mannitol-1-phosphate 5-dehydrogenase
VISALNNKLVLFGAGKIGRSFIGQLFSRGGYEVVFIDVYQPVIEELNRRHNYNVVIKGEVESVINIQNVRAVFAGDAEQVVNEIATARIVAVSVGLNGLKSIIPLIANGLIKKFKTSEALPIDIIIAENLRNAAEFMRDELLKVLPEGFPLEDRVGLIETSIGKMVPIMLQKDVEADILQVFAEPYNTLILDKLAFKNPITEIEGLAPKKNMKAWVDRKLFIHNLGHATAAYLGFLAYPESTFLYEVLSDSTIKGQVRQTMLQAAKILLNKYPDEFTLESLTDHIDDLISRFQNKALGDTIFRVGCDLKRKLSAEDRLAGAIHLARELNLPYDLILNGLVSGCHFRATDEDGNLLPADREFMAIFEKGIKAVMISVCGFDATADEDLLIEAIFIDHSIRLKQ